ncbi:MAG: SRPBCC family protein [Salinisphaeraceae bacterium]|nr:SRPBCC family protein [Salinisphaeraceae bacterium]
MKLIKTLILAIIVLAILAVVAGLMMDSQWRVERRAVVNADPTTVYADISRIRGWQEWTAWNTEAYPDMQISYSGPERGVGARQSWDDGAMTGTVEITAVQPNKGFDYVVSMEEGKYQMQCSMQVAPADAGAEVIWACEGDSGGNPFSRLMMAAYKPMIGKEFETGLNNLQQRHAPPENANE